MAIGPADRGSDEQEDRRRREVEEPEIDGQPAAEQDGHADDRGDRQRLAAQIVVRQRPVCVPQSVCDEHQDGDPDARPIRPNSARIPSSFSVRDDAITTDPWYFRGPLLVVIGVDGRKPADAPARQGFCAAAQSAVWVILSRSSTSPSEATPPASRSLLVNTDQLIATIVAMMPMAR